MTILRLCMIGAMLLFFAGCNSDPPVTPNDSVYAQPPVVTGFAITSHDGQECGHWGIMNDQRGTDETFQLYLPYPNPFFGGITLACRNTDTVIASVWIVRGVGPGEATDVASGHSIEAPVVDLCKPISLFRDRTVLPGATYFSWDGKDKNGNDVRGGFYRIYLRTGDKLYWVDALCMTSENWDEFSDIRDIMGFCH